jgi:hypothetical protein
MRQTLPRFEHLAKHRDIKLATLSDATIRHQRDKASAYLALALTVKTPYPAAAFARRLFRIEREREFRVWQRSINDGFRSSVSGESRLGY